MSVKFFPDRDNFLTINFDDFDCCDLLFSAAIVVFAGVIFIGVHDFVFNLEQPDQRVIGSSEEEDDNYL